MTSSRFISRSMAVAASTAAFALAFTGLASAATTITPAGGTVTATNVDTSVTPNVNVPMVFTTTGGVVLRCTSVTGTGTIPTSPGNTNTGTGGVNVSIASVGLSGCSLQGRPATVATSGAWTLNGNNDSGSPKGTITIPNGGVVVTSGACSITVNATTTPPLPYSNGPAYKATATGAGPINFTSNGGTTFCPAAGPGTATMDGALFFPGVNIT